MSVTLIREALAKPLPTVKTNLPFRLPALDWLSFPVFAACVFAFFVYFLVPGSMADPDIWWHLRNAEWQIAHHAFLHQDVYSFTAQAAPWMNHEWLAEIPFYVGWRLLGPRGVYLVTLAAIECILLAVFFRAYNYSRSVPAAFITSAAAVFLSTVSFGPRTLLFGWICLVLELILLERFQAEGRGLWALPPLFLLWVNLHGSWVIGLVLFTGFLACQYARPTPNGLAWFPPSSKRQRKLLRATLLSLAALFVNPYGWHLVFYPFDLAFRQKLNIANVEEWRTLDFHSPRGRILLVSLAILFLMQIWRKHQWRLHDLFFLAVGIYASFTYSRFLFLAAILVMPLVAKSLGRPTFKTKEGNQPWLNLLILAAVFAVMVQRFPTRQSMQTKESAYPREALTMLNTFHPQGRVFNEFLWGGFLDFNARHIPVFVDSRVDIFEYNGSFRDYLDIIRMSDSLALLDRYKIRYVLYEKDSPLAYLLEHTEGWKVDYQDATTILLERSPQLTLD